MEKKQNKYNFLYKSFHNEFMQQMHYQINHRSDQVII